MKFKKNFTFSIIFSLCILCSSFSFAGTTVLSQNEFGDMTRFVDVVLDNWNPGWRNKSFTEKTYNRTNMLSRMSVGKGGSSSTSSGSRSMRIENPTGNNVIVTITD